MPLIAKASPSTKAIAEKWMKTLRLQDWNIYFKESDDNENYPESVNIPYLGWCKADPERKEAVISVRSAKYHDAIQKESKKELAELFGDAVATSYRRGVEDTILHELVHVMLWPMADLIGRKRHTKMGVQAEESAVNSTVNALFAAESLNKSSGTKKRKRAK